MSDRSFTELPGSGHGKHYVYTLAYPDGRVFYVGKGTRSRINEHERPARNGVKSYKCSVIRKIWREGGQVVKTILARFGTNEEACMYEIALIFLMDGLTNLASGGDVPEVSAETRRKISALQTGRKQSRETIERRRAKVIGHSPSEETRRKISEAHKGKIISEETRRKLRGRPAHNKGRPMSEEQKHKISAAHKTSPRMKEAWKKAGEARKGKPSSNKGKPMSEAQKRKLSATAKANPVEMERIRAMGKAGKGQVRSEEWRRKQSESHKGKKPSEENLRKLREANIGRHRQPPSEETRRKISEAAKKQWTDEASRQKLLEARRKARENQQ